VEQALSVTRSFPLRLVLGVCCFAAEVLGKERMQVEIGGI
jgi:hypothetical protein